jgi:hypothetical protein
VTVAAGWLIAHEGGWDELLFVLVPIGLFGGLLAIANRRASSVQAERDGNEIDPDDGTDVDADSGPPPE